MAVAADSAAAVSGPCVVSTRPAPAPGSVQAAIDGGRHRCVREAAADCFRDPIRASERPDLRIPC